MKPKYRNPALSVMLSLALCGCADSKTSGESDITPTKVTSTLTREERIELRRQMQEKKYPEMVAQDHTSEVTGEVPDELLNKVMADLEQRIGAERSEFTVKRAEAVQWNDGSLGCPKPGLAYQQLPVSGYWIVIDHQGKAYDYRTSERGYFVFCSNPRSAIDQIRDKKKGPQSGAPVQ